MIIDQSSIVRDWPDGGGYLLNHSAGLPPLDAAQSLTKGLFGPWVASDDQLWPHWMKAFDRFREALARVMSHDAAMICPQPSVSAGLTQILHSLPVEEPRRRLLIAERAFPSLGFVFELAQRRGFELQMIPRDENTLDPQVWAQHLDERVHCALFTHVHSNTGECHDITTLCALARDCGAISVVDVAQSIGIRPVHAAAWNADFIIGSCIKWLCGGSGAGFLWVHPDRLDACEPEDVGWFSHRDPFEFDINHFDYAPDALRFWGGTPSVAPALVAAHAIERLLELGLERIEAHNRELGDQLVQGVDPRCLVSPVDPRDRGGSVILQFGDRQESFAQRLKQQGIQCDMRDEGIRLSPHFYNTTRDIERVLGCAP